MLENSLYILITMTGIYSAAALFGCLHILKWRGIMYSCAILLPTRYSMISWSLSM